MRIAVIGSGLGGLSAAATLAARGYDVEVFEKNAWLGGKAAQLQEEGFRFDMGPTILIRPSVLRRIFSEAGKQIEDYLDMVRLDPQWRCFFEDGLVLDLKDDLGAMATSLDALRPGMGEGFLKFQELSEQLHEISNRFFFWKPVGSMMDTFDLKGSFSIKVLKDVMKMRLGKTVGGTIRDYIPDLRVAQMLDHYTQYVGSSPDASPAILCAIGHMQSEEGIWYPKGGTRAVPEALVKLGRELGVKYHPSTEIERLVIAKENGAAKVTGLVTAAGETLHFDAVVSNEDAVRTYRELVQGKEAEKFEKERAYEPACSGVVLYLGLNKRYEHLAHHCFVFSRDPEEEFHHIYDLGEPAPDPTCYLASTTRTESETAPDGGDALYVLVHTPFLRPEHNWDEMFPKYRQVILDKLKRTAGMPDLEERIVFERALTPVDIHNRYKVLNGAIYGLSSHGKWTGAFKPSNRRRDIDGLFLAGGAAHPGPGMPMVLMSGWIAADAVDSRYRGEEAAAGEPPQCRGAANGGMNRTQVNTTRAGGDVRTPSKRALGLFSVYLHWYLRRHFHSLRVANAGRIPPQSEPLILFGNHASWWDPLMAMILGRELLPEREHYAPMDSIALEHYKIFKPMGFFPIENASPRGAAQLLRAGNQVLSRPKSVLWITPESQFQDVRKRPVVFKPGIGALMSRRGRMTCVPIAIEYAFWNERLPEILVNVGEPLEIADGTMEDARTWTNLLSYAMAATLDELAMLAMERDPDSFETVLSGSGGIGGVYELWKRFTSAMTGKPYHHDHGSLHQR